VTNPPTIQPGSVTPEGRIVRTAEPRNDEFDLGRLDSVITPNAQFYIRSHGSVPDLDPATWRLAVTGLVERPLSLSLADLRRMQPAEDTVTLECAGNRRTFQDPIPGGVPWQDGAVSTARWGGVPLAALLRQAGVKPEATHVLLEGADTCPTDSGPTVFARTIPLDLALDTETLLALTMNGEPLPRDHGAPARVAVPRYYAMNSIKWLTRINVQAEAHTGHFQTKDYLLWYADDDPGREIGPVRVIATIAGPRPGSRLPAGRTRVHGAAWTGAGTVERVEVSTDSGSTWHPARFTSEAVPGVWRLWEHDWEAQPGDHTLMARATDSSGGSQPASLPPNRKGYANNFVLPVPVRVH
jgi:DMSO/TMAO reductase YedYZ molybdopterin-dependent catalytic subunit